MLAWAGGERKVAFVGVRNVRFGDKGDTWLLHLFARRIDIFFHLISACRN